MTPLARARAMLAGSERVVSFSGAGLSAESGIATFRDVDGAWAKVDPRVYASTEGFLAQPGEVSGWYQQRRRTLAGTAPNLAHHALSRSNMTMHITQNVDNLLERAGASNVAHLHGVLDHDRCQAACGYRASVDLADPPGLLTCPDCGAMLRPDVVWFGEMLPELAWRQAEAAMRSTDLAVVIGTSAAVWPAAGLIELARCVVSINTDADASTSSDHRRTVHLVGPAAELVPALLE